MPFGLNESFHELSVLERADNPVEEDEFQTPRTRPKRSRRLNSSEKQITTDNSSQLDSSDEENDDSVDDATVAVADLTQASVSDYEENAALSESSFTEGFVMKP